MNKKSPKNDGNIVFVKRFRHWRTGEWVYPVNGDVIRFWSKRRK